MRQIIAEIFSGASFTEMKSKMMSGKLFSVTEEKFLLEAAAVSVYDFFSGLLRVRAHVNLCGGWLALTVELLDHHHSDGQTGRLKLNDTGEGCRLGGT